MDAVKPALVLAIVALTACGGSDDLSQGASDPATPEISASLEGADCPSDQAPDRYASQVVSFAPGAGAGYGTEKFPGVVFGPPRGGGTESGSLDVLSLGNGGEIILGFGDRAIQDGAGADFIVFENPFWPEGDSSIPWAELAEVSVSEDGLTWFVFPCDAAGDGNGRFNGCAGWRPVLAYDPCQEDPLAPEATGGDPFDLADLGLFQVRYVRIRDMGTEGGAPNAGFDLDAVGISRLQ